jgi:hypothetical protein
MPASLDLRDFFNISPKSGEIDKLSTPFCSKCPWCLRESQQIFARKGILEKDAIFRCLNCRQTTIRCKNFDLCNGAVKSSTSGEMCSICDAKNRPVRSSIFDTSEVFKEREERIEKCTAIRNALFSWPGPESTNILRFSELVSHLSWIFPWLEGASGDESRAVTRILNHLQWRISKNVDNIVFEVLDFILRFHFMPCLNILLAQDSMKLEKSGEMYLSGVDKNGVPSWTWRMALHDSTSCTTENGVKSFIGMMERALTVNPSVQSTYIICDCSNTTFLHFDFQMVRVAFETLRVR